MTEPDKVTPRRITPREPGPIQRPTREQLYEQRRVIYEEVLEEQRLLEWEQFGGVLGHILRVLTVWPWLAIKGICSGIAWVFKNAGQLLSASITIGFMLFALLIIKLILMQKGVL